MKTFFMIVLALLSLSLVACGRNEKVSDAEIQATVQAALYATSTAQANSANQVNNAVNATLTAIAPSPTAQTIVVTATPNAQPTIIYIQTTPLPPTATPANVVVMTEQELAALIDQAVAEAYAAAETAYTTTTTSTADDTVTTQESQSMTYTVQLSEQQVEEALALIDQYYAYYSEVSQETLATLQAIEQDLNEIAASTTAMAQSLEEINQTLQQGLELAQETIDDLETAAQNAQQQANDAKDKAQTWYSTTQAQIETRAQNALDMQPNAIANTPQEAVAQIRGYVETAQRTLNKNKLSKQDINTLAQQGANAKASVQKFGNANAQQFSGSMDKMTVHIAKGEMPQAKQEYGNLEKNSRTLEFNAQANDNVRPGGNNPMPNPNPKPRP